MDLLPAFGAKPIEKRVVRDRNRITAAGVSAGIDFALTVAAGLHGEAVAREIQLGLEYGPQPAFDSRSPRRAGGALVEAVRARCASNEDTRRRAVACRSVANAALT
jgi:cyclohexyl-isocyanide hydratase